LFYSRVRRAFGIGHGNAESGVAKMSLYRSFRSKDELIAACLEERNTSILALFGFDLWPKIPEIHANSCARSSTGWLVGNQSQVTAGARS